MNVLLNSRSKPAKGQGSTAILSVPQTDVLIFDLYYKRSLETQGSVNMQLWSPSGRCGPNKGEVIQFSIFNTPDSITRAQNQKNTHRLPEKHSAKCRNLVEESGLCRAARRQKIGESQTDPESDSQLRIVFSG